MERTTVVHRALFISFEFRPVRKLFERVESRGCARKGALRRVGKEKKRKDSHGTTRNPREEVSRESGSRTPLITENECKSHFSPPPLPRSHPRVILFGIGTREASRFCGDHLGDDGAREKISINSSLRYKNRTN